MTDIKLSTIAGGGGLFVSDSDSAAIFVSSGATTTITIVPSTGKRLTLTLLEAGAADLTSLTTVTVGSRTVINAKLLSGGSSKPSGTGTFSVGGQYATQKPINGKTGESIAISFNIATTAGLVYAFEEGELS